MAATRHIVFIQHGDYREAVERFAEGGGETYASQRYSVELVAGLLADSRVTVMCLPSPKYDVQLENGVRSMGMGWAQRRDVWGLLATLEKLRPTDLIVRTPFVPVLAWALARGVRALPLLADSFGADTGRVTQLLLPRLLNSPRISVVGNHNVFASRSLAALGVQADKIVPWDWPPSRSPYDVPAKRRDPGRSAPFSIFYAGMVSVDKGVGDLVDAVAELSARGVEARLVIAGPGALAEMKERAIGRGVSGRVEFLGRIPNTDVFARMRDADAVVVPSRPTYPEGLPIVVTEGLCSRTPLVLSSHPVFERAFSGQRGVLRFHAADPRALADALERLHTDPELYAELSENSALAWDHIQLSLTWGELVLRWLANTRGDLDFLRAQSLARQAGA